MFTIQAHGIPPHEEGDAALNLSPAQHRLLAEPKPIRICGAPTGAGKTYAFLQAARQEGQRVVFVVPTQALARDIEDSAHRQGVVVCRWDGAQSAELRANGGEPWIERKNQWDQLRPTGGMVVTTPETLGAILLGKPQGVLHRSLLPDLLQAQHIVFDEAHTLTARAFGFLHFWAVLAVWWHRRDPVKSPKLTLLSATHSNLFRALCETDQGEASYLPPASVAFFDEAIEDGRREGLRMLHGEVEVHIGDGDVLACVEKYAAEPLSRRERLLVLYDSLRNLTREEEALRDRLGGYGVRPEECFLINGQDRKAGGLSLGDTGFEAGLCPQEKHRVIIATSCVEAGVNIQGLRYAILDPGLDAAALLQRIGRVARGDVDGKVWLTTPDERRSHWLRLEKLTGTLTIAELRECLEPLRDLPLDHARRLGSAYWSMLKREQPSLYAGLLRSHESISEAKAPGGFLNGLHAALTDASRRGQKYGREWLNRVDRELADLRGFSPSVSIRFADYPVIEYSLEWAQAYLEKPEPIRDDGIWRYRKPRSACFLERPQRITVSLLCPDGGNFTREYFPRDVRKQAPRDYAAHIRRRAKGLPDETFLMKAAAFVEATNLLIRENMDDDPVI
jgi:superfamily II DNA/RNA helicase